MSSHASVMAMVDSTRQRLGFRRDKTFVPTPNVRNPQMLQEAEAFSEQLAAFERAVRDYHKHAQGFLRSLVPLMECNLPRVWTLVEGGLAEPVRPAISHGHPTRVGGDYSAGLLLDQAELLQRGIDEEVLAPLRRWQEGLVVARERMAALDRLRAEVDSQRRKAEKKFKNAEAKLRKAYLGAGYGSSSSSDEGGDDVVPRGRLLEDYQRLALHTERQLNAITSSYADQERLVWEQLSGLVTDASWLESYAAATMIKVKEAMQGVAVALGPSKQPLPAYRGSGYSTTGSAAAYGQVGDNTALVAQMSPRALQLAHGAIPRGAAVLPYQPLRAKRGMATPLLVAASASPGAAQRQLALQPVPPVALGAAGVPLNALPRSVRDSAIREVEETVAGEGVSVADAVALPPVLDPSVFSPTRAAEHGLPPSSTAAIPGASSSLGPRPAGNITTNAGAASTAIRNGAATSSAALPAAGFEQRAAVGTAPVTRLQQQERRGVSSDRLPPPPAAGAAGLQAFGSDVMPPAGSSVEGGGGSGSAAAAGHAAGGRMMGGSQQRLMTMEDQPQLKLTRIDDAAGPAGGGSAMQPPAAAFASATAAPMGASVGSGNSHSGGRGLGESREATALGPDRSAAAGAGLSGAEGGISAITGFEPAAAGLNGLGGSAALGGMPAGETGGYSGGAFAGRSDDVLDSFSTPVKEAAAAGADFSPVRPSSTGGYSSSQGSPRRSLAAAIRAELGSAGGVSSPPPAAGSADAAAADVPAVAAGLARVNSHKLTGPLEGSAANSEAGESSEGFRDATSQAGSSASSSYASDLTSEPTTAAAGSAAPAGAPLPPGQRGAVTAAPYSPSLGAADAVDAQQGRQPELLKVQQQLQQVEGRLASA